MSYGHAENYLKIENVKMVVYLDRKHYISALIGGEMPRLHSFENKIISPVQRWNVRIFDLLKHLFKIRKEPIFFSEDTLRTELCLFAGTASWTVPTGTKSYTQRI